MKLLILGAALACMTLTACGSMPEGGAPANMSGGGGTQTYQDGWASRPDLVDPTTGDPVVNPGEHVTDHPSVDPDNSGFSGEGPPSIDG